MVALAKNDGELQKVLKALTMARDLINMYRLEVRRLELQCSITSAALLALDDISEDQFADRVRIIHVTLDRFQELLEEERRNEP